jgi:hypothetical protein
MALFSSNDDFTFTSSDEEFLKDMYQDDLMIFQMMLATSCNSNEFFTPHEMEEGMGQSMDLTIGVWDVLATM